MIRYLAQGRHFTSGAWLVLASVALCGITGGVFGAIFNLYLVRLGLLEDFIGLFAAAGLLGNAIFAVPAGAITDRLGKKPVIIYGAVLSALLTFPLIFVTDPVLLLIITFLGGAAGILGFVPVPPFLAEQSGPRERTFLFAVYYGLNSLTSAVGAMAGGVLPGPFSSLLAEGTPDGPLAFRYALLVGTIPLAIGIIPLLFISEAPSPAAIATVPTSTPRQSYQLRSPWANIWVICAATGLLMVGVSMITTFYNVYLNRVLGATTEQVGSIFALANLLSVAGTLLASAMADRIGRVQTVVLGRLVPIPPFVALVFVSRLDVATFAFVVRNVLMTGVWAVDTSFAVDVIPPRMRATMMGARSTATNLAWAIAAAGTGTLIIHMGYPVTFLVASVIMLASTVIYYGAFRRWEPPQGDTYQEVLEESQRKPTQEDAHDRLYHHQDDPA